MPVERRAEMLQAYRSEQKMVAYEDGEAAKRIEEVRKGEIK